MIRASALRRLATTLLCALALVSAVAATDRKFVTSTTLATEARTLVQVLNEAHYNHDAVRSADYAQVIPDYMEGLDGQHLFLLSTDKTAFVTRYGKSVYYNTALLGNIDDAYEIFRVYEGRTRDRINWIFEELKKDFDFTTSDTYGVDRTKAEWPASPVEADQLWRKRLKFEILNELLIDKKKPVASTTTTEGTAPTPQVSGSLMPAVGPDNPHNHNNADSPPKEGKTGVESEIVTGTPVSTLKQVSPAPALAPATQPSAPKVDDAAKALTEAKQIVRKRYERMLKNLDEIETGDLAELYLGSIARLYDPHSTYFSADTFEDFGIQMKLQLVGIGALLSVEDDICVVKELVPGGPADLDRQLKPNDKIISVSQKGGEPVEIIGMKLRKIVDMIRGQKGTQVHLLVQPADATDPSARKEIIITRDIVKLNSQRARAAVFQVPGADGKDQPLGVITLPAFYGPADEGDTDEDKTTASRDVARLITQLKQSGVQGIVLDLRHNGGGFLTEAINLAGLFINNGPVVQVKSSNGEIQVDSDDDSHIAYDGPLAVLVDRFSASAAEIVTGALQNYGRAIIIGDSSTHGKGSVQQVAEMKQISRDLALSPAKTGAVKFTIQKYYLPSGDSTQLKGVIPDIVLPSIDDYISGIGESALPHALVWDKIPTSFFDGAPLDAKTLIPLRQASLERQNKLEEFTYLRKNIDWFKDRQAQKLVSLNLAERKKQKESDDAFRKTMKAEKAQLAQSDFTFKEFRLGPPTPPKIKAAKKDSDKSDGDSDDDFSDPDEEENDTYTKADVPLREALRVIADAIALGHNHEQWVSDHAPLTVSSKG